VPAFYAERFQWHRNRPSNPTPPSAITDDKLDLSGGGLHTKPGGGVSGMGPPGPTCSALANKARPTHSMLRVRVSVAPRRRCAWPEQLFGALQIATYPVMRGRVIQSSGPIRYAIVEGIDVPDNRVHNYPPRWNAAPSQELLVIRRNHRTGEVSLDPLRWGLIPYWCQDPKGGRKPITAKCETVDRLPMFREAYRRRRCIVPVDGFFEGRRSRARKRSSPMPLP
jgi:hypothetical protein